MAVQAGQLELNVMMPVIAWNALHAAAILAAAIDVLRAKTIEGLVADEARCRDLLERSAATATALNPHLGYATTAKLAQEAVATGRPLRELVIERGLLPAEDVDRILSAEAMTQPGVRR
jgi:aspartate ammonia-lyase